MRNQKERDTRTQGYILFVMDTPAVSRAYLSQKLTRPLVTKGGGTLCTVLDARTYMLALPKRRETAAQWQRAAELLLAQADVAELTRAVDLALFYDAKVDVSKVLEA